MKKEDLKQILESHVLWLIGDEKGTRADLSGADLREANLIRANLYGANLREADLSKADLRGANLREADLSEADLYGANLREADLSGADLYGANLREADLSEADLREANLYGAKLREADLSEANLYGAKLREADLSEADLYGAKLREANLNRANLSDAKGLLSAIEYMQNNFEKTDSGFIAYKTFGGTYEPNTSWVISAGETLEENVNPTRTIDCGCGINVATLDWVKNNMHGDIWKVLIKFEWLPGVVVPYNTDGKIRCERVQLIEKIER